MTQHVPTPGPNTDLPTIWMGRVLKVRSTIALLITVATPIATAYGIELSAYVDGVAEIGRGADMMINGFQILLPALSGIWLWLERRAPNYRLTVLPTSAS